MRNNEFNFLLNDLKVYREYDLSNFISNAKNSLSDTSELSKIDIKFDIYISMLSNTMNDCLNITSIPVANIILQLSNYPTNLIHISAKKLIIENIIIEPGYLTQFVDNIGLIIDRICKGKDINNDIERIISNDMIAKVKRQMVRTSTPINMHIKDIADKFDSNKIEELDGSYIKNDVIPYLKSQNKIITKIKEDIDGVIESVINAEKELQLYMSTLFSLKDEMTSSTVYQLNYIMYNTCRALIEAVSFLSFMTIRKANIYISNMNTCLEIYNKLVPNTTEGAFDTQVLLPTDTASIADAMISGRADAYETIANNIYEFNTGSLMNSIDQSMIIMGKSIEASIELNINNSEYNNEAYQEANKMYIAISQGLDKIAAESDEYLLVSDDIINSAGFSIRLEDRFRGRLPVIDDISIYADANGLVTTGSIDQDYFKILHEVKDYPQNMSVLAQNISEVDSKIKMLIERFDNNIDQDYKNSETVKELKIFLEDLCEQFTKLTNIVSGKFMLRLKSLGLILNQINCSKTVNDDAEDEDINESTNFNTLLCESIILNNYDEITDKIFEELTQDFYVARQMKVHGIKVVLEADTPTSGTTNAQTQQTGTTQKSGGFGKGIVDQINKWFEQVVNKINSIVESQQSKRDQEYLNKFKSELLSKDYSSLSSPNPIYNYEALQPYSKITNDLNGLKNRVNTSTLQKLNGTHSKDDIIKLLFGNTPPMDVWKSDKPADAITQYYKVGANKNAQASVVSGDLLKTIITNGIGYCEQFYTNILPNIRQTTGTIKNNLSTSITSIIKESANDMIFSDFFMEDAPQQSQPNNVQQNKPNNTNTNQKAIDNMNNISDKVNSAKTYIIQYCNAVLTASFDRYNDYMRLFRSMVSESNNTAKK